MSAPESSLDVGLGALFSSSTGLLVDSQKMIVVFSDYF